MRGTVQVRFTAEELAQLADLSESEGISIGLLVAKITRAILVQLKERAVRLP